MKITNRKFLITIYWMLLGAGFVVAAIVGDTEIPENLIMWLGIVSCVYIGGNVVQKFIIPIVEALLGKLKDLKG